MTVFWIGRLSLPSSILDPSQVDSGGLTYEQVSPAITIDNAGRNGRVLPGSISLDEHLPADSVVTTLGALDPDNVWVTPTRLASSRGRAAMTTHPFTSMAMN